VKRAVCLLAVAAVFLSACGTYENGGGDSVDIRKTSDNTWTIYDPDSQPDAYLDKTCQTQGREVLAITAPGEAYQWLYVTCAPKDAAVVTVPTTTQPDSFSP